MEAGTATRIKTPFHIHSAKISNHLHCTWYTYIHIYIWIYVYHVIYVLHTTSIHGIHIHIYDQRWLGWAGERPTAWQHSLCHWVPPDATLCSTYMCQLTCFFHRNHISHSEHVFNPYITIHISLCVTAATAFCSTYTSSGESMLPTSVTPSQRKAPWGWKRQFIPKATL